MSTETRVDVPVHPDLAPLIGTAPVILIFLPGIGELQRFVWSGAFDVLGRDRHLHFVLPAAEAHRMRDLGAPRIRPDNSSVLDVPVERFETWTRVFKAGCVRYARLSPSFAIREGLEVDPAWRDHWTMPAEERRVLDAAHDAEVESLLTGLEPLPGIAALIARFQPICCVVPTSLLDPLANEVAWSCEREHVACLFLQSGWDNMSSKGLVHGREVFAGCWGPQSAEHARVIQRLSHKRLETLGAPHYESLRHVRSEEARALRARLGAGDGERLVLFGGSFRQFDETSALVELETAITAGRLAPCRIVYRPHPWRATRRTEESFFDRTWTHVVFDPDMQARYLQAKADPGYLKRETPTFDMAYLSTLIAACDAVISPMSTLLIESLILEKPSLAVAYSDGQHRYAPDVTAQTTHCAELRGASALAWCHERGDLVRSVARILDWTWDEKRERSRWKVLDQVVTREPGTYAERLATFCRERVEPHGRKWRARRTGVKRDSVSHAYGAHLIAQRYCGLDREVPPVPGYWMHGWLPAFHSVHPNLIANHKQPGQGEGFDFAAQIAFDKAHTAQWVSRQDQVEYLTSQGYRHVRAIGLPIAYLPDPGVRRVPGSLLVLPPHSQTTRSATDPVARAYAASIAALRPRFAHIWVGLNEDDVTRGQWVDAFRAEGLPVFTTADQGDPDTLVRLQRILSTFEYVTTNGFGSHIAFAAYCGARVSIYGPFAEFPAERVRTTHTVKIFPELEAQAAWLTSEAALRQQYPFLFVEPDRAALHQAWGAAEVGEPCRVQPGELRDLFGWRLAGEVIA